MVVIINPTGAAGAAVACWERTAPVLKERGFTFTLCYSTVETGIADLCRMHAGETLIIVGGDGTFNEAANGIRDESTTVAFLPAGSGNDLARDLQLPSDPESFADLLARRTVRPIDVGTVEYLDAVPLHPDKTAKSRQFLVSCGIGFDAETCAAASDAASVKQGLNRLKAGKLIYILQATRLIFTCPKVPLKITLDGTPVSLPSALFSVSMIHRYEGGGFMFCPDANDSDGLFDIMTACPQNRLAFFPIFPTAYSGRHTRFSCVHLHRAATVEIESPLPLYVHTDGEVECRAKHILIRPYEKRLRLLV